MRPRRFIRRFIPRLFAGLLCALNAGCFDSTTNSATSSSAAGLIGSSSFAGAKSATNVITGVKIAWEASKLTPSSYRVYRSSGTKLTLLATLGSEVTSFIDGSVTWGTIYTYVVRAVDSNNVEDTNLVKVSSLAWAAASGVTASSRSAVQVDFSGMTAVADEIRIYIQPAIGGTKTLAATVSGSDTNATISGLKTGYSYLVSVQAYVATLKKEDGNTATYPVTTNTLGFHDEDSSSAKWLNITNVRAFGVAPGAGLHPTYPERTPRTNLVELSFRSFSGMASGTQYVVTRTPVGATLDTSVSTACTSISAGACRVRCATSSSILTGSGVLQCRDEDVGASPNRYRYTMSILHTSGSETWVEPVPQDQLDAFSVLVAMPPKNMVLTQRDAANYEMCSQMNAPTDPRRHNRCPYTGVGAVPYNSGPSKAPLSFDAGFYDFGYNLFVNRFEMGCKWTRAVDGGMCGAGATAGDCIAVGAYSVPANTVGKDGDVFFYLHPNENACFYKYSGTWYRSNGLPSTVTNPAAIYAQMFTSDPTANSGKVASQREFHSQYHANEICKSETDAIYGTKRIPRLREFRAFTAMPTMPGDVYGMTYAAASTVVLGGAFNASSGFRCPTNVTTGTYAMPASISDMLNPANDIMALYLAGTYWGMSFSIASSATSDCQGRYGLKDAINRSTGTYTSDNMLISASSRLATGMASLFDNGNRDLLQDINGGQTGFTIDYTAAFANTPNFYYHNMYPSVATAVNYIVIPLGLPVLSASSSVYLPRSSHVEHYNALMSYPYAAGSTTPRSVRGQTRWDSTAFNLFSDSVVSTNRCVMSAD